MEEQEVDDNGLAVASVIDNKKNKGKNGKELKKKIEGAIKKDKQAKEIQKISKELKKAENNQPYDEELLKTSEDNKRRYYKKIIEKNISLVEKKEFSIDPNIDKEEKIHYLLSILNYSYENEASQKDCIEMYEKYGFRYWRQEIGDHSFIADLLLVCGCKEFSDRNYVINKFLDIAEKHTLRDPKGMRDGNKVLFMYEYYGNGELDEKTTLRFINLMKKISFQQLDAFTFELHTQGKLETPEIKKAIQELKEITKDFPEVDRTKNT
jgi:hypothetical protein